MDDVWTRIAENLMDRISGPMKFRLLLQPVMAVSFATIAGLRDARTGNAPYFWSVITDRAHRGDMLRDGWKDIGKVFAIAIVLDVIYQMTVLRFVYPGEAILVAVILAILPYLVMRGLVTRICRRREDARSRR